MKGIFTALLTPFKEDYSINEKSLKKLVEFNLEKGVNGFYVGGSTGESMVMTAEERKEVFRIAKEAAGDSVPMIAHCGAISTDAAIDMAKTAEALGYTAVSAVAPFYYSFPYQAIRQYYTDIVSSVNIPMVIYNFPGGNGFTFDRYESWLLLDAINRAKKLYFEERGKWDEMAARDMNKDVSWENSAKQYKKLYLELTQW